MGAGGAVVEMGAGGAVVGMWAGGAVEMGLTVKLWQ